jgi:hypothetical protein
MTRVSKHGKARAQRRDSRYETIELMFGMGHRKIRLWRNSGAISVINFVVPEVSRRGFAADADRATAVVAVIRDNRGSSITVEFRTSPLDPQSAATQLGPFTVSCDSLAHPNRLEHLFELNLNPRRVHNRDHRPSRPNASVRSWIWVLSAPLWLFAALKPHLGGPVSEYCVVYSLCRFGLVALRILIQMMIVEKSLPDGSNAMGSLGCGSFQGYCH